MRLSVPMIVCVLVLAGGCGSSGGGDASTASGKTNPQNSPMANASNAGGGSTNSAGGVSEADLGVPFYPGSTVDAANNGDTKTESQGKTLINSNHVTNDPPDKIASFYKEKLPGFQNYPAGDSTMFKGKGSNGNDVSIAIGKEGDHSTINIISGK